MFVIPAVQPQMGKTNDSLGIVTLLKRVFIPSVDAAYPIWRLHPVPAHFNLPT